MRRPRYLPALLAGVALTAVGTGATQAQDLPPDHGAAMSAPLFVQDLPVGTVSIRLARPSMTDAIAGVAVLGTWTTADGKPGTATVKSGDDGRAIFSNVPAGATFAAKAKVDGDAVATAEFTVPAEGGTKLLLIVGANAAEAMAEMTGQSPHGKAGAAKPLGIRAGKVQANDKLPAGTVEIRVVGVDGKPIAGLHVDLASARKGGAGVDVKRADTDVTGVARFTALERSADRRWAAVVDRNGLRIGTELFAVDGEHGASGELRIPDRTNQISVLRIAASTRMMIELREDSIAFLQNLVLENPTDKVFDPGPAGLLIPLPDGCSSAEKMSGGADVELKDATAVLHGLIPPTDVPTAALQIRVGCVLATHETPEVEIVQPMPFGMQGGVVMIPAMQSVGLSAPGLTAHPVERDDNGNELRMYQMGALAAGQPLRLVVYGLPTRSQTGRWIAGVLASLLVLGGVMMVRRPRKPTEG